MLTAAGIGSGLDIESIISQLMTLEQRPLTALRSRESDYNTQLSGIGRLKSAVSGFQSAMEDLGSLDKFRLFETTSSDEDILTATADSDAAAGVYSLDIQRLAQNHKLATDEFAKTDTLGGTAGDTLSFAVDGDTLDIDLSSAQTLEQIRDSINNSDDNPGVTASILNTGSGNQRLILTSDESGYDERIQLSFSGSIDATTFNFADANRDASGAALGNLTELDASFTVDGFAITTSSNQATDVIDGIELELTNIGQANLTINRDDDQIQEAAQNFVDAYNELQSTSRSLRSGDLSNDSTVLNLQNQFRDILNTPPSGLTGSFSALSEIGITTDATSGELSLDSSDFSDALSNDFSGLAELFAHDDQGYAFRFAALADSILEEDGLLDSRDEGLRDRISDVQDQQRDVERRLELKERQLRSQYSALDGLLGSLQSTSNFLLQQLG